MNDPQKWQNITDALGMDVEIDPEKVKNMFDDVRFYQCGAACKNGKPCGVAVHENERCWRHRRLTASENTTHN
jgi:hypothetical protein